MATARLRTSERATATGFWISLIAILLLVVSGWLGGKMVYTQGVAVDAAEVR